MRNSPVQVLFLAGLGAVDDEAPAAAGEVALQRRVGEQLGLPCLSFSPRM
jgi:hypothetical protein